MCSAAVCGTKSLRVAYDHFSKALAYTYLTQPNPSVVPDYLAIKHPVLVNQYIPPCATRRQAQFVMSIVYFSNNTRAFNVKLYFVIAASQRGS
jgi:hypothetical protein